MNRFDQLKRTIKIICVHLQRIIWFDLFSNRVPTRMEFGECIYDFDIIDVAERSPLNYLDEQNRRFSEEQGC